MLAHLKHVVFSTAEIKLDTAIYRLQCSIGVFHASGSRHNTEMESAARLVARTWSEGQRRSARQCGLFQALAKIMGFWAFQRGLLEDFAQDLRAKRRKKRSTRALNSRGSKRPPAFSDDADAGAPGPPGNLAFLFDPKLSLYRHRCPFC